uniref:Uncharacterized protein n=1 Tax=Oryzias latipes TaxID=8090 RepID=A0A3B3HWF9_ORYLA
MFNAFFHLGIFQHGQYTLLIVGVLLQPATSLHLYPKEHTWDQLNHTVDYALLLFLIV